MNVDIESELENIYLLRSRYGRGGTFALPSLVASMRDIELLGSQFAIKRHRFSIYFECKVNGSGGKTIRTNS